MAIEVILPPSLQILAGNLKEITAAGNTIGECLEDIVKKYPAVNSKLFNRRRELVNGINIFLNNRQIFPRPLVEPVNDGDRLHISFTVLGG